MLLAQLGASGVLPLHRLNVLITFLNKRCHNDSSGGSKIPKAKKKKAKGQWGTLR